jgi:hypothetical protein
VRLTRYVMRKMIVSYNRVGSIYNRDVQLDRDFFGERHCSLGQSVIKAHPQDVEWRGHPNPHRYYVDNVRFFVLTERYLIIGR